jgi:hypothetical protein
LLFLFQEVELFVELVILILVICVPRELIWLRLKALDLLLRLFHPTAQVGVNFDVPFHLVDDLLALVVHGLQLVELFGEVSRRLLEVLLFVLVEILIIGRIVIVVVLVIWLGATFGVLDDVRRQRWLGLLDGLLYRLLLFVSEVIIRLKSTP